MSARSVCRFGDSRQAQLGKPLLELSGDIAQRLMPIARFVSDHPEVTKYALAVMLLKKGLVGLVETGYYLRGFGDFFTGGARSAATAAAPAPDPERCPVAGLARCP